MGGGECYEPADRWHIVKAGRQVESRASAEASRRCVLLWQLWRLAACGGQHYEPPACCRPLACCEDWVPSRRLGARSNQFFVLLISPTQEGTVASTTSSRQLADCRRKNGEAGLPRRELSEDYNNTFNAVADCRLWGGMCKRQGLVHGLVTNVTAGQWHPATRCANITKS